MEEGALPQQIDKVVFDYGFPMGPFAMSDLAGNDVGWRIRQGKNEKDKRNVRYTGYVADAICTRRSGRARPEDRRGLLQVQPARPHADPRSRGREDHRGGASALSITRRAISDQEILERCLYPMVNEGAKILEEGMAQRSLDIDVIWVNGYGHGRSIATTPMWWADNVVGLKTIRDALLKYRDASGDPFYMRSRRRCSRSWCRTGRKFSSV